jgi:hypothetical protein
VWMVLHSTLTPAPDELGPYLRRAPMPRNPDAYQVTAEEVHDVVRDRQHYSYRILHTNDMYPVDRWTIAETILGFDPIGSNNTNTQFGGKSKSAWVNPHLSVGTLDRVLNQLVEDGVLVKVHKPDWRQRTDKAAQRLAAAVKFHHRIAGYVTKEALDESYDRLDANIRNSKRAKLMKQARDQIADKYAKQVQAVYAKMCADDGLDPVVENVNDDDNSDDEEF